MEMRLDRHHSSWLPIACCCLILSRLSICS
ncbi:hypothetical protein BDA96_03G303900 [Sorghum bicolor]|uniref:Uncharacterized protein n=1 Tax=Sorghum bicolor TaxID=4558 RepID=A0A921RGI5_SORBI|nr:hypothetical protein BDA96_03G303900 [Sorghum bicolor]